MEILKNIKWYHIVILCLIIILIFLIFSNKSCHPTSCKNAQIKDEGFNSQNNQDNKNNEIILYYATWCGHSKNFLPEWEKFENYAKNYLQNIKVRREQCENGNEKFCTEKGVHGYPTVIFYLKNGSKQIYSGERKMDNLIDFAKKNMQ